MNSYLILESGELFSGLAHNSFERAGEVVFNTSHSGYEEIATDPSYFNQMVVMTSPMQGNYGVNDEDWESRQFWIEGFIATALQRTWTDRLAAKTIPCLSDLDTRRLVIRLREGGTVWGALVNDSSKDQAIARAQVLIREKRSLDRDWVALVSRKSIERRRGVGKDICIAVIDFGCKENILRLLLQHCSELVVFPSRASAEEILAVSPDAVMLTNGPGDPADVVAPAVAPLIGRLPIFGICMGHQVLALALGAKTSKLKFGHRGSNHPVSDSLLNKVYMTAQNHGYCVTKDSLPLDIEITHYNLNDNTVAGIMSRERKFFSVQFHPESHPGPHDAAELFSHFFTHFVTKKKSGKT